MSLGTCKGLLAPREESGKNRLQNKGLLNTLIPGGVIFVLVAPVGHFFAATNNSWFTKSVVPAIPPLFKT